MSWISFSLRVLLPHLVQISWERLDKTHSVLGFGETQWSTVQCGFRVLDSTQTPLPCWLLSDALGKPKAPVCSAWYSPLATTDWDRNNPLPKLGQSDFLFQAFGIELEGQQVIYLLSFWSCNMMPQELQDFWSGNASPQRQDSKADVWRESEMRDGIKIMTFQFHVPVLSWESLHFPSWVL